MVSHLVEFGFTASREAFRSLDKRISACFVHGLKQKVRHTPVRSTFSLGVTTSGGADDGDLIFRQARSGPSSVSANIQRRRERGSITYMQIFAIAGVNLPIEVPVDHESDGHNI